VRHFDADQLLIEKMLRPPPLEQARNSLEFWRQRRTALPFYRRAARREADEMIRRSYAQVEAAVRRRYGAGLRGLVRRVLAGEPIPWALGVKPALVTFALRIVPRRYVIGAAAAAAAVCLLFSGVAVALVVLVLHAA
jgi:hypothetical protein